MAITQFLSQLFSLCQNFIYIVPWMLLWKLIWNSLDLRKNTCLIVWGVSQIRFFFFSRYTISSWKEWRTNNDFLSLGCLADISQKRMRWACHLKIKILAVRWRSDFYKTCIWYYELGSFPTFNDFLGEISDAINEHGFLILYNEMVHSWKICIIQQPVFQMTNACHHKIMHWQKSHS